jgi:hypothetical protein
VVLVKLVVIVSLCMEFLDCIEMCAFALEFYDLHGFLYVSK